MSKVYWFAPTFTRLLAVPPVTTKDEMFGSETLMELVGLEAVLKFNETVEIPGMLLVGEALKVAVGAVAATKKVPRRKFAPVLPA